MMIFFRNALAYLILDKKPVKKQLKGLNIIFQMVFYNATFYHYSEKKLWLLGSSGL